MSGSAEFLGDDQFKEDIHELTLLGLVAARTVLSTGTITGYEL